MTKFKPLKSYLFEFVVTRAQNTIIEIIIYYFMEDTRSSVYYTTPPSFYLVHVNILFYGMFENN